MHKHKKHHFVPKLYLRHFTVDGKNLSIYNISKKRIITNIPYDSQCSKDYYYGTDSNVTSKNKSRIQDEAINISRGL